MNTDQFTKRFADLAVRSRLHTPEEVMARALGIFETLLDHWEEDELRLAGRANIVLRGPIDL